MRRYKYKIIYTWLPEIAYLTGLIAADGCLIGNGRHVNITSKDSEIIMNTQQIMNMNVKISTKRSSYGGEAYHLQFSNVSFYDFLLSAGLTPAKSKTIGEINIPDSLYPDFLRGYFDGDGTVYGYWDKRWKNSLMYYTGFISASLPFLEWLQKTNTRLSGTSSGHIKPNTTAWTLTYAKMDSQKLFSTMYYADHLPQLNRKYDKFLDFLRSDPYASKATNARVLKLVDRPA